MVVGFITTCAISTSTLCDKAGQFGLVYGVFNNISVILWQSVLLLEEIGVPVENHRPIVSMYLIPK
jgi:hypothetical protein